MAQKRTSTHSWESWRVGLGEVEVLTMGPEGTQGAAGKLGMRGTPEKAVEIGGRPGKQDRAVTGDVHRMLSCSGGPLG